MQVTRGEYCGRHLLATGYPLGPCRQDLMQTGPLPGVGAKLKYGWQLSQGQEAKRSEPGVPVEQLTEWASA